MNVDQGSTPLALRRLLALAVAMAFALFAAACGSSAAGDGDSGDSASGAEKAAPSAEGEWPRTVATDDGDLTLEARPERIVSTSITLTGALLSIDAPVEATAVTKPNIPELSDANGFFNQWGSVAAERGVKELWSISAPDVEKVISHEPDLIVVAKNSGDSAFDIVDKLREIAPVLVVDYSGATWQDVTKMIAKATGLEGKAEEVIGGFDRRLEEVKGNISVPDEKVSTFIVLPDDTGAAALTDESPQVQILSRLGFAMAEVPDEVKGDTSLGKDRKDIVNLSKENVQKGLLGTVWICVAADDFARNAVENDPAFNTSAAVKSGDVHFTPGETFRIDYYSAMILLDSLEESFRV